MTIYSLQKAAREARARLLEEHGLKDYDLGNALASIDALTVLLDRSLTVADREDGHILAAVAPWQQRATQAVLTALHGSRHRVGSWLHHVDVVGEAVGLAVANPKSSIWVILTDADWQSGQAWAAVQLATAWGLNQLTFVTVCTGLHNGYALAKTVPVEPLRAKLAAFNLAVYECDATHYRTLIDGFHAANHDPRPSALLITAVYGSGLDILEEAGEELLTTDRAQRLHELMSER